MVECSCICFWVDRSVTQRLTSNVLGYIPLSSVTQKHANNNTQKIKHCIRKHLHIRNA